MDGPILERLKGLIKTSPCPVGCRCHRLNLEELCKARTMGVESLLECLEEDPEKCVFAFAFGGSYFCRCGTRKEIAKLLGE